MLLILIGHIIEGCENFECRDCNARLVRSLFTWEADLARFEEQSGPLGKEGSESFDRVFEVQLA